MSGVVRGGRILITSESSRVCEFGAESGGKERGLWEVGCSFKLRGKKKNERERHEC